MSIVPLSSLMSLAPLFHVAIFKLNQAQCFHPENPIAISLQEHQPFSLLPHLLCDDLERVCLTRSICPETQILDLDRGLVCQARQQSGIQGQLQCVLVQAHGLVRGTRELPPCLGGRCRVVQKEGGTCEQSQQVLSWLQYGYGGKLRA
jgi:hypothetical protein